MKGLSSIIYSTPNRCVLFCSLLSVFIIYGGYVECRAQSVNQNYIMTEKMLSADNYKSIKSVQYHDGLGRPNVLVSTGTNNSSNYIMTEYDKNGREAKTWLPVVRDMSYDYADYTTFAEMSANTYPQESFAYEEQQYDALNREIFKSMAGSAWNTSGCRKGVTTEYTTNKAKSVKKYKLNSQGQLDSSIEYYPEYTLTGTLTKDADKNSVEVFKDIMGNVILERRNGNNDTYYVYDCGLLRVVIPPLYQTTQSNELLYQYKYDAHGRCIEKKLPGCVATKYWYDKGSRVAFMQDGEMRKNNRYRFYIYDGLGRLAVQGICTNPQLDNNKLNRISKGVFQTFNSGFANTGYSISGPVLIGGTIDIEIVNYYDGYTFLSGSHKNDFSFGKSSQICSTGLLTGTIVKTSNGEYIYTIMHYDEKGLLKKTVIKSIDNVITSETSSYSFTNNPIITNTKVVKANSVIFDATIHNTYDENCDLLSNINLDITVQGKTNRKDIASYRYDNLGRIVTVVRDDNAGNIEYSYDIHGWTTSIATKDFCENLYYATGKGIPCYNGNISSLLWKNNSVGYNQGYKFKYDGLNRLVEAVYGEQDFTINENKYNEKITEYDANGNINKLQRFGLKQNGEYGLIDDLGIKRVGNQLKSVSDNAANISKEGSMDFNGVVNKLFSYKYNSNGSLEQDENRGIAMIEYDDWNNPQRIQFTNGNVTEYIYTATGQKLRTIHYTVMPNIFPFGEKHELSENEILCADSTDYLLGGTLLLKNGTVDKYLFNGGYCHNTDSALAFYYFNQDHLGNNREVVDEEGRVVQTNNYYPFGTPIYDEANITNASLQPFKYNGKELDMMHGLNTYDYGARQYYAALPVWDRVDPLAEKHKEISPYTYCANNPVNSIDPDGRDWYASLDSVGSKNGQTIWQTQIHYTDCTSQEQMNENNIDGTYMGETVVVFDGYLDERLADDNTLDGTNSKHATATVYGAEGPTDITKYTAFTMTSNFDKYGAIQDGIYRGSYIGNNKPNHIPKPYVLENGGAINTIDGNRYEGGYSKHQKNGIFIHRTNNSGTANGRVSIGCLLINAKQMSNFEKHVGRKSFKIILRRK